MRIPITFRPLSWDRPITPSDARRSHASFRASWSNTQALLDDELDHLDGQRVVLQADFREQDLRVDGMPRANARQPEFPGIKISFDSQHGPLVYATDTYAFWQHNVRAIALALEALRAVNRYGVTKRAEQYQGWKAIGAGPTAHPDGPVFTRGAAAGWLAARGGAGISAAEILAHPDIARRAYKRAALRLHPDTGGDAAEFRLLGQVMAVLDGVS